MTTTDLRNRNGNAGFGIGTITDKNLIVRWMLLMVNKIKPEKKNTKELYQWKKYSFMQ